MTEVLVISDVHANAVALEAVLADAGKVDETWCLGDVAGYGPQPNECIQRIHALPAEAEAPLVIDADAVLACTIPFQSFQAVPGRRPQVVQPPRLVQQH